MSYSDTVSIAATTSGVAGTITVPAGAHLTALDISFTGAAGAIPVKFALSWPQSPQPLNFTPNIASVFATPAGAISQQAAYAMPLNVTVEKATVVTITVTSTGNVTVQCGLRW